MKTGSRLEDDFLNSLTIWNDYLTSVEHKKMLSAIAIGMGSVIVQW